MNEKEDTIYKLSALADASYSFYRALKVGKVPNCEMSEEQLQAIDAWINNYEVLHAELVKFNTNATVH